MLIRILILSVLYFSGCAKSRETLIPKYNKPEVPTETPKDRIPASTGLKNFRQIYSTMSQLTGVAKGGSLVQRTFSSVMSRLPEKSDVNAINAPFLTAVTSLAGVFCYEFIALEKTYGDFQGQRKIYGMVNFKQKKPVLSSQAMDDIVSRYGQVFWQREPSDDEKKILRSSIENTFRKSSQGELRKSLLISCTIALSNLDVLQL